MESKHKEGSSLVSKGKGHPSGGVGPILSVGREEVGGGAQALTGIHSGHQKLRPRSQPRNNLNVTKIFTDLF